MRREYNGLTGTDCKKLLLIEIDDILSREGRLTESQVYHNVSLRLSVELESYPHEPAVEKFTVEASVGEKPKVGRPRVAKATRTKDAPVPDLARDEIEAAPSDVAAVMAR